MSCVLRLSRVVSASCNRLLRVQASALLESPDALVLQMLKCAWSACVAAKAAEYQAAQHVALPELLFVLILRARCSISSADLPPVAVGRTAGSWQVRRKVLQGGHAATLQQTLGKGL
jgi:hypothetical protein